MDIANFASVVCKVSIVDEQGRIVLDTLVNPETAIDRSLYQIHGIKQRWLNDAPGISQVREHLK